MKRWVRDVAAVWLEKQGKFNRDAAFARERKSPFSNGFNNTAFNFAIAQIVAGDFCFTNSSPMGDLEAYVQRAPKLWCAFELRLITAPNALVLFLDELA